MRRDLQKMANTDLGILVIGGGINGAGIVRDSAIRGIKAGLVEKQDFAWGTTGRSTMLIHGGLRYLEEKHFGLVRESLHERAILQFIAKDITTPVPFLIPVYQGDTRSLALIKLGLTLYDFLAGAKKIQSHRLLSVHEILQIEPQLRETGLQGGAIYYDCQTIPERLTVANLWDAFEHGAQIANYAEVVSFLQENGRVIGAVVKDLLDGKTYEIKAKVVINATGPWLYQTLGLLDPKSAPVIRPTKGIHLVVQKFTEKAVLISARVDGRVFFVIPWGDYSLIGTTDTDFHGNPDEIYATDEDIHYLLTETNRVFPNRNLKVKDILFTYAGVRPLIYEGNKKPYEIGREHKIIRHPQVNGYGLLSIVGGKLTTYRSLAKQVMDIVHKEYEIPQQRKCQTHILPLEYQTFPSEQEAYLRLQDVFEKSPALNDLLKKEKIVKANEFRFRIALACDLEMVRTPADFLLRRTQLGLRPGFSLDILPAIAEHMGTHLGWKPEDKEKHIENYKKYVHLHYAHP